MGRDQHTSVERNKILPTLKPLVPEESDVDPNAFLKWAEAVFRLSDSVDDFDL